MNIINKTTTIVFLTGLILGLATGFFVGKGIYDRPFDEDVKSDTVWITDTLPDYTPSPKDSVITKWVTKYLPKAVHDTVESIEFLTMHDTVAVEVPITSKHYSNDTYDAWVSGFEPNLDSIKVYQKTEIITNTITRMKPPNKWELDVVGGIDYNFEQRKYTPHVGGELLYKPSRLQFGIKGGIEYNDRIEPKVGGVMKIRIF